MKQTWPKKDDQLQAAWDQRYKLRAEGYKLHAEGDKLYAEGNKLHAEGDKLYAEGNKLHAEGDKLRAEGNLVWINAVIAVYGPKAKLTWTYKTDLGECTIETEELNPRSKDWP